MKSFLGITTSTTNTLLVHFGSISETLHQWGDAFYRNGPMGLFILAVIESSFFPVPPDFVMIPLAYDSPEKSFYYATICTIGSVIGAVFGWLIGRYGGEPVVRRLIKKEKLDRGKNLLRKYDALAIGIAGFTPIPYKVFTITAGIINMNLPKMLIVSVFARGGRFFLVATFFYFLGKDAKIWIEDNFAIFTMGIGVGVILVIFVYYHFKRKKNISFNRKKDIKNTKGDS